MFGRNFIVKVQNFVDNNKRTFKMTVIVHDNKMI